MTLLKQLIKLEWMHKCMLFHSSMKVLSPAVDFLTCNVEYLSPVIRQKCLFCLYDCKISWFLSIIVILYVGVRSTNVVCPHNRTYNICIFAIFWKVGFVDITPLWYKPSTYSMLLPWMSLQCIDAKPCFMIVIIVDSTNNNNNIKISIPP